MKTKRFVSTLLALLLVCSLPVSAFAGTTENTGPMENNNGYLDVNASTGTITNNNGYVLLNYGSITNNCEGGEVDNNNGAVGTNDGDIVDNGINDHFGTVGINNGQVKRNNEFSTVTTNNGTVERNLGGTVTTNNGTVNCNDDGGTVETNKGTVNNNFSQGTVSTNEGTVTENLGTVTTNEITGTVTNKNNGTVGTNYGTVNEADGTTHYGVQVDNEGDVSLAQKENGETWDLAQLFTKAGYVLTGFIQAYQTGENGLTQASTTVEGTSYTADCPNVLTLIWQAIVNPGSGEIAAAASDGTGSFGPGSVISINGYKFLLVAVVEDVYCLASVDSFEDEALSDLPVLLASLLTEEQLTHVTGEPELLDEALTARFFAGQGSHIVFPCDSGLIFS